jgi:hypothetical protein
MKKFFILSLVTLAFAACSNENDAVRPNKDTGDAITFRSVTQKTRATETDITNIKDFKVFGMWDGDFEFMYGVNVVRNAAAWEYAPASYWPVTGTPATELVDFYAFSPAGSLGVTTTFAATATTPLITYTVPVAENLQEDFLVAATPDQNSTNNPVLVNFKHALSQAVFEARSALNDVLFNVEAIEITNLKYKADLDLSATTLAWSNPDAAIQNYPAALETIPVTYHPTDYTRLSGPNDGLMLLPQTLVGTGADSDTDNVPDDAATGNYLVVTYGVNLASSGVAVVPAGTKAYLPIAAAPTLSAGFEMGKKYVFQLDMSTGLTPITFTVNLVEAWDEEIVEL